MAPQTKQIYINFILDNAPKRGKKKSEETNATPFNILQQRLSGALCKIQDKKKRKEKKILIPLERGLVQNENKKIACEHARTWSTDVSKQSQREILDQEDTSIWDFFFFFLGGQMFVKIDSFFFLGNN